MPKKLMDCVKEVGKKKGKKAAWPICVKSTGQKPHKKMVKESVDTTHIRNFISNLCDNNFSEAGKSLKLAIREKTKNYIELVGKEKV